MKSVDRLITARKLIGISEITLDYKEEIFPRAVKKGSDLSSHTKFTNQISSHSLAKNMTTVPVYVHMYVCPLPLRTHNPLTHTMSF